MTFKTNIKILSNNKLLTITIPILASAILLGAIFASSVAQTDQVDLTIASNKEINGITSLIEEYGKIPLSFELNEGQTDKQVNFLSRGNGYYLFLTPNEAVLSFSKQMEQDSAGDKKTNTEFTTLHMKLINSNPNTRVFGLEELPRASNYFFGNNPQNWKTDISNYKKVQYQDVYPGIDLIYYGNQRQLEYDFVLEPGADPNEIQFRIDGADRITTDDQNNLILEISNGELIQHAPIIYQEIDGVKQTVPGNYVIKDDYNVGFEILAYDTSKVLVIDPVLSYSTYLGGTSDEFPEGNLIDVDSFGNVYVAGQTFSIDFPTVNPIQPPDAGNIGDAYVTKINPEGNAIIYSTYIGGSFRDKANVLSVDSAGNVLISGNTQSTDFPTVNPFQATIGGQRDVFVTKINSAGNALVYSTYLGGSMIDFSNGGIAVDSAGNAYVTTTTISSDFPTVNPLQPSINGVIDATLTKFTPSGTVIYSTFLGGSAEEIAGGVAVDSLENVYIKGDTNSADFPTVNPIQPTLAGETDLFVTKINAAGNALVYSTYLGGSMGEFAQEGGIEVDSSGHAYIAGLTLSADFPTVNAIQPIFGGQSDATVTKINAAGNALLYSTYLGGNGEDPPADIAVDSSENVYVMGTTNSADFPTVNPIQGSLADLSSEDIYVTKINAAGNAIDFSTYLGGTGGDLGAGIAVDSSGCIYITGFTDSFDFPTVNAIQSVDAGSGDAFVAKIADAPSCPDDTDGDGIFDDVDTLPNTFSNDFSDIALSGTTSGTIVTRGDQTLAITEETNPNGVRSAADFGGGPKKARLNVCGAGANISLDSGDVLVLTCASVTIQVISGTIEVTFVGDTGQTGIATINGGNELTFEPETFTFTAGSENTETIIIEVDDGEIILNPGDTIPGDTIQAVNVDIKPGSEPNCFNNNGNGVIPVAILGSTTLDVNNIDSESVTLEGMAIKAVGKSNKLLAHIEDTNSDGIDDLIVQIEDQDGVFEIGDTIATISGQLLDGTTIVGSDSICIT